MMSKRTPAALGDLTQHPALEANERAVIGAILADPERVLPLAVKAGVTGNSFTTATENSFWDAIVETGGELYPVAMRAATVSGIGTAESWLVEAQACFRDCLTTAHAAHYIRLLRKAEAARKARAAFAEAIARLDRDPAAVWDVWKGVALDMREAKAIRDQVEYS